MDYDKLVKRAERYRDDAIASGMSVEDAMKMGWYAILATQNTRIIELLEAQAGIMNDWAEENLYPVSSD